MAKAFRVAAVEGKQWPWWIPDKRIVALFPDEGGGRLCLLWEEAPEALLALGLESRRDVADALVTVLNDWYEARTDAKGVKC